MNAQTFGNVLQLLSVVLLLASGGGVPADGTQTTASMSRQEFAKRVTHISENTTAAQLIALLGKPDYIGHLAYDKQNAVWFYGCEGPRKLPTLATIYCDEKGHLTRALMRGGSPPGVSVVSESELRKAMLLLDQMPAADEANPGTAIRIANELLPLGKTKILAAIKEYERVIYRSTRPDLSLEWKQSLPTTQTVREALYRASTYCFDHDDFDNLVYLLRFLFDIPANAAAQPGQTLPIPIPLWSEFRFAPPFDHTLSPRFPMALFDDVPLVVSIEGYAVGGQSETAADELPYFEKFGRIRTVSLHPTDHPETLLADFQASPLWLLDHSYRLDSGYPNYNPSSAKGATFYRVDADDREWLTTILKKQILRMLTPLYPAVAVFDRHSESIRGFAVAVDISKWDAIMADLNVNPVLWNQATQEYERRRSPDTFRSRHDAWLPTG